MKNGNLMKQFLMSVLVVFLMCFVGYGQALDKKSKGISKPEQQVMALNRAWADAITKGDAAALDRLFADDMIVTSGSGAIRDKAGEIKDAAGAPDPDFVWTRPFTTEDVRVKIYRDAAAVTGLAKWAFKYKGQEVNQERRFTQLYVKQHGQWRIVAQQVSSNLYKKPQTSP
ncbi:MAG: nuclear transport factor 2 family protein [Acidobacteriota bacterium]|nr:nuclear transport factor 2 family protein [Acidobacteriota bacterium]